MVWPRCRRGGPLASFRAQAGEAVAPGGQGCCRCRIGQDQGEQEGERGEQDDEYEGVGVVAFYEDYEWSGQ